MFKPGDRVRVAGKFDPDGDAGASPVGVIVRCTAKRAVLAMEGVTTTVTTRTPDGVDAYGAPVWSYADVEVPAEWSVDVSDLTAVV